MPQPGGAGFCDAAGCAAHLGMLLHRVGSHCMFAASADRKGERGRILNVTAVHVTHDQEGIGSRAIGSIIAIGAINLPVRALHPQAHSENAQAYDTDPRSRRRKGRFGDGPRSAGGYLGVSTVEGFLCCRAARQRPQNSLSDNRGPEGRGDAPTVSKRRGTTC
jgi:hypothetical protein